MVGIKDSSKTVVIKSDSGRQMFTKLLYGGELNAETTPLLSRVEDQLP